jgi:cyclin-dependent kinase 12/13
VRCREDLKCRKIVVLCCRNRDRNRSPSPHSIKSSQLKNKITDTSLFAELVKDRHKRELELKKLENFLEHKNDKAEAENEAKKAAEMTTASSTATDQVDSADKNNSNVPVPMDIDDIPIPSDQNQIMLNDIALPDAAPLPNDKPERPPTPPLPNSLPPKANAIDHKAVPPPPPAAPPKKNSNEAVKKQKITKLPMPPGINQSELEMIESPPSRSPTPPPPPIAKPKTPPKKGIMNLPMPPGEPVRSRLKCSPVNATDIF